MKKKIKSAVISIVVIAVLLLAILIRNADTCNKTGRDRKVNRKCKK